MRDVPIERKRGHKAKLRYTTSWVLACFPAEMELSAIGRCQISNRKQNVSSSWIGKQVDVNLIYR